MTLTKQQFVDYLCNNKDNDYQVEGTEFRFSLHAPREPGFPYSIRFSSEQWSKKTKRSAGAKRIVRFLGEFNAQPNADWREYRNREGKASSATTAKYLIHLMRKACE